jgi:hypothetical protein
MTAKQKIETLTNSWYGYVLFTSAVALVERGLGVFSILTTAVAVLFNLFIVWYLGRKLLHKSSLTRVLLVLLSGIMMVLGAIGTAKIGWAFLHEWSLSLLVGIFFGGASVVMNARSFRVLTDSQVKAYFS